MSHGMHKTKKSVEYKLKGHSDIKIATKEATNSDPFGPNNKQLKVLADASWVLEERHEVMHNLWKRLDCRDAEWVKCRKALTVLSHLVAHGPEDVVHEIKSRRDQIREIAQHFKYVSPEGVDRGPTVREAARSLYDLVTSEENVQRARERAARTQDRFTGMGSGSPRPTHSPSASSTPPQTASVHRSPQAQPSDQDEHYALMLQRRFDSADSVHTRELSVQKAVDNTVGATLHRCIVTHVRHGSPAQRAGLTRGMLISRVDGRTVSTHEEAKCAIETAPRFFKMIVRQLPGEGSPRSAGGEPEGLRPMTEAEEDAQLAAAIAASVESATARAAANPSAQALADQLGVDPAEQQRILAQIQTQSRQQVQHHAQAGIQQGRTAQHQAEDVHRHGQAVAAHAQQAGTAHAHAAAAHLPHRAAPNAPPGSAFDAQPAPGAGYPPPAAPGGASSWSIPSGTAPAPAAPQPAAAQPQGQAAWPQQAPAPAAPANPWAQSAPQQPSPQAVPQQQQQAPAASAAYDPFADLPSGPAPAAKPPPEKLEDFFGSPVQPAQADDGFGAIAVRDAAPPAAAASDDFFAAPSGDRRFSATADSFATSHHDPRQAGNGQQAPSPASAPQPPPPARPQPSDFEAQMLQGLTKGSVPEQPHVVKPSLAELQRQQPARQAPAPPAFQQQQQQQQQQQEGLVPFAHMRGHCPPLAPPSAGYVGPAADEQRRQAAASRMHQWN
eukprot:TRINITY_DN3873_c0_g1_i1.p1 TRINITY_DN3873_c0_g1~~TRINITY_DN3873_c0_g1_i1.p1  ORF type:complete len:771 (+),score=129.13 TRINITY_DN3873_c0_g1_i1:144-2315(+)